VEASASATAGHMAVTGCDGFQFDHQCANCKTSQKIRSFFPKPSLEFAV
jgi:hypothetical protein